MARPVIAGHITLNGSRLNHANYDSKLISATHKSGTSQIILRNLLWECVGNDFTRLAEYSSNSSHKLRNSDYVFYTLLELACDFLQRL